MICIYCLEKKESPFFKNTEHVVPQSFGVFENNFTLNGIVCDECNKFFGDNLEVFLARDSYEGISRYNFELQESEKFKTMGKRSKLTVKVNEGLFRGAYAYLGFSPIDGKVVIKPLAQIGFRNNAGHFQFYLLDEVPNIDALEKDGFNLRSPESIFILGCEIEKAIALLTKQGITSLNCEGEKTFSHSNEAFKCKIERVVDNVILRSIAKIAFNYLTFCEGPDFVLNASFNTIRNYVRWGYDPGYPLVTIVDTPILGDEPKEGFRRVGHIVTVDWDSFSKPILSQVSLFNWITYKVLHATVFTFNFRNIARGHFFDPFHKQILRLGKVRGGRCHIT